MNNTGKYLERLVRQVEEYFLPDNCIVKSNEKVYNDDGIQLAEFDIEIKGKLGTTEINWLIECRDRPSQGAAPGSWIEQLVARRSRFNFNKVTAVSSTGFAEGVKDYAEKEGIELRTVKAISIDDIKNWCGLSEMILWKESGGLNSASIVTETVDDQRIINEIKALNDNYQEQRFIWSSKDNKYIRPVDIFQLAITQNNYIYDDIEIGKQKQICAEININEEYPCFIKTKYGDVRLLKIICDGYIIRNEERRPVEKIVEYSNNGKEKISQVITMSYSVGENQFELNAHKMKVDGRTIITLSKLK
jgi:hypothetical protein